ncbi:MAG: BatA domain-containing protein [Myxococcota bacterium]
MSFQNPLMLAGLLAAALPIIIHLIHRRKPRRQPFAAIELLLRSIERVERRFRLRRWLLLATRILLMCALPLAAARPWFGSTAAVAAASQGPRRLAIVIDASLSMRARYAGGSSAFERAVVAARTLVERMGAEDQALFVVAGAKPRLVPPRPIAAKSALLAELDKLKPTFEYGDLAPAITAGAEALRVPDKEGEATSSAASVIVLSDIAGHGIRRAAELSIDDAGTRATLELIDVVQDVKVADRRNYGVSELAITPATGRGPGTVDVTVKIRGFSADRGEKRPAEPVDITLRSGDADLYAGSVDVAPAGIVDKTLGHAFPSAGYAPVQVVLQSDALAEDDTRYAIADVRRAIRTLVVDGAPSGVPKESETFYLMAALAAGASDQPPPRVVTADDLAREDLAGVYDVIVLAGVPAFAPADGPRLLSFVENGGGLLISAAEGLDVDFYNSELGALLPRGFRGLKMLGDVAGSSGVQTLKDPKLDHPVLTVFDEGAQGGLLSARTRGYLLLEPERKKPATVLLRYEDGQPALLESRQGRGRVMLLTTSIDRDLSDLPIRPAFLPLIRRVLLHLGDALARPPEPEVLVGEPRTIQLPAGMQLAEVVGPSGEVRRFGLDEISRDGTVVFDDTRIPGHYTVRAAVRGAPEPVPGASFAVNVDPRESDVRPLEVEEAEAVLLGTAGQGRASTTFAALARIGKQSILDPELLPAALLVLLLLSFFFESALTARRPGL